MNIDMNMVGCPICRKPEFGMLPSKLFECLSCGAVVSLLELIDLSDDEVKQSDNGEGK